MMFLLQKYRSVKPQVKASFWFFFCSVMQRGISIFTTPIFTRLLSTSEFGQYGVFNSWLDIVTVFVTFRIYYGAFVQGLVKNEKDKRRYASSIQGLLLSFCMLWTLVYYLFSSFWNDLIGLTTVQMSAMLLMIWAVGAYRLWAAEQRNECKYKTLVIITVIVNILKPVVGIFLVINSEDKVTARIIGLALVEVICFSWTFFYQISRGKQFYSAKYWKHALLFSVPLIPHYLSQTILNSADRIMIKNMIGDAESGIYSLAYSLAKIMTMVSTALNQTLSPWMYKKIKINKAKEIERITYPTMIIVGAINLFFIAFAPEILVLFAPNTYHEAIWVIPPVTLSVFLMFSYQMFAAFEFYYEKTRYIMVASVSGAILNIILNYIFIRKYGYVAAGYTTLICYLLYTFLHYCFMKKIIAENLQGEHIYELKTVGLIVFIILGTGLLFLTSYNYNLYRYGIICVLFACVIWKRKVIKNSILSIFDIKKSNK